MCFRHDSSATALGYSSRKYNEQRYYQDRRRRDPIGKKSVVFREIPSTSFQEVLGRAANGRKGGVEVEAIVLDQSPMALVYNPDHPDARPDGYVEMPNVDLLAGDD